MRWTACECTAPGWCERHECFKHDAMYQQCQVSQELFELWEQGNGPCLPMEPEPGDENGPGLVQRAANFGKAVARHLVNGMKQLEPAAYDERIAICHQCPACDTTRLVCRHQQCGCFLTMKARWASEDCPLQRWPPVVPSSSAEHPPEKPVATDENQTEIVSTA